MHMEDHEEETPYPCPHCHQRYKSRRSLYRYMLGHTDKDTTAKSDSRSIICNSHIDKEKTANSNSGNIIFDSHIDDVMKTNSDSTSRSILANSHTDKKKTANSH